MRGMNQRGQGKYLYYKRRREGKEYNDSSSISILYPTRYYYSTLHGHPLSTPPPFPLSPSLGVPFPFSYWTSTRDSSQLPRLPSLFFLLLLFDRWIRSNHSSPNSIPFLSLSLDKVPKGISSFSLSLYSLHSIHSLIPKNYWGTRENWLKPWLKACTLKGWGITSIRSTRFTHEENVLWMIRMNEKNHLVRMRGMKGRLVKKWLNPGKK